MKPGAPPSRAFCGGWETTDPKPLRMSARQPKLRRAVPLTLQNAEINTPRTNQIPILMGHHAG